MSTSIHFPKRSENGINITILDQRNLASMRMCVSNSSVKAGRLIDTGYSMNEIYPSISKSVSQLSVACRLDLF